MTTKQREWAEFHIGRVLYIHPKRYAGKVVDYKVDAGGYGVFFITDAGEEIHHDFPRRIRVTPDLRSLGIGMQVL